MLNIANLDLAAVKLPGVFVLVHKSRTHHHVAYTCADFTMLAKINFLGGITLKLHLGR